MKLPKPIWGAILGVVVFSFLVFFLNLVQGPSAGDMATAIRDVLVFPGRLIAGPWEGGAKYMYHIPLPFPHEWILGYLISSLPFAWLGFFICVSINKVSSAFVALSVYAKKAPSLKTLQF